MDIHNEPTRAYPSGYSTRRYGPGISRFGHLIYTIEQLYDECVEVAAEKTAELEGRVKVPVKRPWKTEGEIVKWFTEKVRLAATHTHALKELEELKLEGEERSADEERFEEILDTGEGFPSHDSD